MADQDDPGEAEHSESGAPIYRHTERKKPYEPAPGDPRLIQVVEEHIERHLGSPEFVLHEVASDLVHLDVHVVPPGPDREFYTLVTSGMSERGMNAPDEFTECAHAELLIHLPPDWPLDPDRLKEERHYWPIRWLRMLALFPHVYDTWLWLGHSVPNGPEAAPFTPGTELCCMLVLPPIHTPPEFWTLPLGHETTIHFFGLMPIHRSEMEFKLKFGVEKLLERFEEVGLGQVLDPAREPACE